MSEASLSLIRSRTVRRPISALRSGTWAKMLVGAARKLVPPLVQTALLVWLADQRIAVLSSLSS
jgi:hypothetical protein